MSEKYGTPIGEYDGRTEYAFPTAEALAAAGVDEIFALRTGFRAKYIYDCADKYARGAIDTARIFESDDYTECEKILESYRRGDAPQGEFTRGLLYRGVE